MKPSAKTQNDLLQALLYATALSAFFFLIYGTCTAITARRTDIGMAAFAWERFIPFIPVMIIPYMSVDLFFFGAPFLCAARERTKHAKRIALAITLAGVFFLLFPLQMSVARPPVTGVFAPVFKFLYGFDKPYNLAPSLHIALRSLLWVVYVARTRGPLRLAVKVWFIFIGVSTLVTYQHQVIDVISGQLLALFCLHLFPDGPVTRNTPNEKIAARYAAGAIVLAAVALLLRPWGLLLLWPAASLAVMTSAYLGTGPAVFRKCGGRLAPSTYILLAPYLLGARVAFRWYRMGDAPFVELVPGVFVGRKLHRAEAEHLLDRGVGSVLDLAAEYGEQRDLRDTNYHSIPILDLTPPTTAQLAEAVAFIRENLPRGVYVHCAFGYSRSAAVAAAFLLSTGAAAGAAEAIEMIRAVRPKLVMGEDLERALDAYTRQRTGPGCPQPGLPGPPVPVPA